MMSLSLHFSKLNSNLFVGMLLLQVVVIFTSLLNIPVARQVFGFVLLVFFPGFIILRLIDSRDCEITETLIFSVGLSIVFIMVAGLLINEFGLLIGITRPLSSLSFILVSNVFVALFGYLVFRQGNFVLPPLDFKFMKQSILPLSVLTMLPILSVVGAYFSNVYHNNLFLMILIAAIGVIFGISIFSKRFLPANLYVFALSMIGIALLFHSSLTSPFVWGGDIHMESFVFEKTLESGYWNANTLYSGALGRLNSMLSISIMPTVFSNVLQLDFNLVLKIISPILFVFVPLGLFTLWKKNIGAKNAFLAAFFFMSLNVFYGELLGSTRQIFAELFFVLLLIIITTRNISPRKEFLLFSIFSFGLIVSHYAVAEFFLFFMFISFIVLKLLRRPIKSITLSKIVLFATLMFLWYVYTSGASTFTNISEFGGYVVSQFGSFFDPSSRGTSVLIGLGLEQSPSIWNTISRFFAYLTELLIIIGFLSLALKRNDFRFERVYLVMSFVGVIFLGAVIVVPGLANTFNMSRFYQLLLFFLAPLCIVGGNFIIKFFSKQRADRLSAIFLVLILVPYFLFQTGFVYEVTGNESWSVPLSKDRMDGLMLYRTYAYLNSWKVSAAMWLSNNIDAQNNVIYAGVSAFELQSNGLLQYSTYLTNTTNTAPSGVVYLNYLNLVYGVVVSPNYSFNVSQLSYVEDMNTLYSNGACEIFCR